MAYRSRFGDGALDRLFDGILCLRSREDCYRFFEDLCTVGELRAMAQRLQVADLLRRGTTYEEIARLTGMSSATVSRIKRFLLYGADGYRRVLERLDAREAETDRRTAAAPPVAPTAVPALAAPAEPAVEPAADPVQRETGGGAPRPRRMRAEPSHRSQRPAATRPTRGAAPRPGAAVRDVPDR